MTTFQNSILINRPLEEVFGFLSNAENDPQWRSGAVEVRRTSEGPVGVDSTWSSVGHLLGQRIEYEMECTEYEANWKYSVKSQSGSFPFESRATFELVAGATGINLEAVADLGGLFSLAEPLLTHLVKRQFQADLANLKDIMEAHSV
jgi:uncharacterized membrane protein